MGGLVMSAWHAQVPTVAATAGLFGACALLGSAPAMPLGGLIGSTVSSMAANFASELSMRALCSREEGLCHPALQPALAAAFDRALQPARWRDGLEHMLGDPLSSELIAQALEVLRADLARFFAAGGLFQEVAFQEVNRLLSSTVAGTEVAASTIQERLVTVLRSQLDDHLLRDYPRVAEWLSRALLNDVAYWLIDYLATDEPANNRAWRTFQALTMRDLQRALAVIGGTLADVAQAQTRPYDNLIDPDYNQFVGRMGALGWLRERLSSRDRTRQIAIMGIGGVGKSALALAIGHEYQQRYKELPLEERFKGIIWVSAKEKVLTETGPKEPTLDNIILRNLDDIYTAIARIPGNENIAKAPPDEQDQLVQAALRAHRTLLIVDNLESVVDERVKALLRSLPSPTKAIITSREWVEGAAILPLTGLPWEEAETLITEEAGEGISLDASQRHLLFERTGGLPLPIKLSMRRLAGFENFDQVLKWLRDAEGDLPEYCIKGQVELARRRDPNAWLILLACSTFDQGAGVSLQALDSTAQLSLADRDGGLTLLQRLSLLNRSQDDRFRMLPMVQGYMGVELTEVPELGYSTMGREEKTLRGRHAAYYLALAEEAEPHLTGPEQGTWLARVEAEHGNLRTALDWALGAGQIEMALRLGGALGYFWLMRGYVSEGRQSLEAALTSYGEGAVAPRAEALYWAGALARLQGDYPAARSSFDKSLALFQELENEEGTARVINDLGEVLRFRGDYADARSLLEESLARARAGGDQRGTARALTHLGLLAEEMQDYVMARAHHNESLELSRELKDEAGVAACWNNLGLVEESEGNYSRAQVLYEESLRLRRRLKDQRGIALALGDLGEVHRLQGDYAGARSHLEESLDLWRRRGDKWGVTLIFFRLGLLTRMEGDKVAARAYHDARAYHEESLRLRQGLGDKVGMVESLEGLAGVAAAQGDSTRVARLWGASEAWRAKFGAPLLPKYRADKKRDSTAARAHLGEATWDVAWAEGQAMSLEDAVTYALEVE